MRSQSKSSSSLLFDDTGAFEVTDLGACSYLDDPQTKPPDVTPRSLTENLSACITSGSYPTPDSCSNDRSADCDAATSPVAPVGNGAASNAFRAARARGTGAFGSVTTAGQSGGRTVVRHGAAHGDPVGSASGAATRPVVEGAEGPRRASRRSDRLDEALLDFVGTPRSETSEGGELEVIYGAVFDPDARARELDRTERERISSGNHAVVPSAPEEKPFGWDDHELDAPIDPAEVRRRVGSRTDGVPQFGIVNRPRKKGSASGSGPRRFEPGDD